MCSYKKTYINTVFINFQFHVCNGNNSLAFMAQLHYITVTCSSSHDPKFKKLYIYIYILGAKCTNHAYKVYIYNSLEEPFQFIYFTWLIKTEFMFNLDMIKDGSSMKTCKKEKKSKKEEEEEDLTRHNPAKYIEGKVTEERPRQEEEWTRAVQQHDLLRNEVYLFLCFFFLSYYFWVPTILCLPLSQKPNSLQLINCF